MKITPGIRHVVLRHWLVTQTLLQKCMQSGWVVQKQ
jgi:hypothetical protein